MSVSRNDLYHYLKGALLWDVKSTQSTLRHSAHLIEQSGEESLKPLQAGLSQLSQVLKKLEEALPKYLEGLKENA